MSHLHTAQPPEVCRSHYSLLLVVPILRVWTWHSTVTCANHHRITQSTGVSVLAAGTVFWDPQWRPGTMDSTELLTCCLLLPPTLSTERKSSRRLSGISEPPAPLLLHFGDIDHGHGRSATIRWLECPQCDDAGQRGDSRPAQDAVGRHPISPCPSECHSV